MIGNWRFSGTMARTLFVLLVRNKAMRVTAMREQLGEFPFLRKLQKTVTWTLIEVRVACGYAASN